MGFSVLDVVIVGSFLLMFAGKIFGYFDYSWWIVFFPVYLIPIMVLLMFAGAIIVVGCWAFAEWVKK